MDGLVDSLRKEKDRARNAKYHLENKERIAARKAANREANRDAINAKQALWRQGNRGLANSLSSLWQKNNRSRVAENSARRRAMRVNATPPWADEFVISEAYSLALLRSRVTGVEWHVDHIVPLRSEIVCGLHCERNLQVITGIENASKGNRHWPDMP